MYYLRNLVEYLLKDSLILDKNLEKIIAQQFLIQCWT